mgnify:CR=1 FL=1
MAITPGNRTPLASGGSAIPRVAGISEGGLSSAINVTPMIDVMLVLLIIFMVVTPILTRYEATPPEAVTARPEPDDDVITLGIDVAGDFFVENEAVTDDQLTARLLEHYRGRPGDRLLVKPGEIVPVDGLLEENDLLEGITAVLDESALTGEALPVQQPADDVARPQR